MGKWLRLGRSELLVAEDIRVLHEANLSDNAIAVAISHFHGMTVSRHQIKSLRRRHSIVGFGNAHGRPFCVGADHRRLSTEEESHGRAT